MQEVEELRREQEELVEEEIRKSEKMVEAAVKEREERLEEVWFLLTVFSGFLLDFFISLFLLAYFILA